MTLKKFTSSIFLVWVVNSFPLFAQVYQPYNLEVGVQTHTFIQNTSFTKDYRSFPTSLNVIYWRDLMLDDQASQEEVWTQKKYHSLCNRMYNYPLVGLYFNYLGGMHSDLGNGYTLGAATDIGIWQKKSNYFSIRPKVGLSYFTQKHHPTNNPMNQLIGSSFNLNFAFGLYYTIQAPIHTIRIGTEFNHFANGAVKQPNDGINLLSVALAYQFGSILYPWAKSERITLQEIYAANPDTNYFSVQIAGFTKQIVAGSTQYVGVNLGIMYAQPMNLWIDLDAKLQLSIDPSRKKEAKSQNESIPNNTRAGVSFGMITHFHRFNLHTDAGIYVYKSDSVLDDFWYQQYQLDYKINRRFFTFASLTSHLAVVDYLGAGLGIKL